MGHCRKYWLIITVLVLVWGIGSIGHSVSKWSQPEILNYSTHRNRDPQIAVDVNGGLHIVWQGWYKGDWVTVYSNGKKDLIISDSQSRSNRHPTVAVSHQGVVLAAWSGLDGDNRRIFFAMKPARRGALWSDPKMVNMSGQYHAHVDVGTDKRGVFYLTWSGFDGSHYVIYYAVVSPLGRLMETGVLDENSNNDNRAPRILINPERDQAYVLWKGWDGRTYRFFDRMLGGKGSSYFGPYLLLSMTRLSNAYPAVELEPDGTPAIAWLENAEKGFLVQFSRGVRLLTGDPITVGQTTINHPPALFCDADRVHHIAWEDYDGAVEQIYYSHNRDGSFAPPQNVSQTGGTGKKSPSITSDPDGRACVVWFSDVEVGGSGDVFFRREHRRTSETGTQ